MRPFITKEELIRRYDSLDTLSPYERKKLMAAMRDPAERLYGSYKNFTMTIKKKKRTSSKKIQQLAAVIKISHDSGQIDVLKCVEAVRQGRADCLRII